jgi:glycosyltransferase involved in cell wall biosynthesis
VPTKLASRLEKPVRLGVGQKLIPKLRQANVDRMAGRGDSGGRSIGVLEPVCNGMQHAPVNAAILQIVSLAYPDARIRFFAEQRHLHEVQAITGRPPAIECIPIDVPATDVSFARRLSFEYGALRTIMRSIGYENSHVIVSTALASTIQAVRLFHWIEGQEVPVQAVLHGYLNDIVGWRSRNPLRRMLDLRSALEKRNDRSLQFLVLEESIRQQLVALLPGLGARVAAIGHPFPEGQVAESPLPLRHPLHIGFLGLATPQKGFDVFLGLAEKVRAMHGSNVQFHALGRAMTGAETRSYEVLDTSPTREGLSRDEYVRRVHGLHFVCLPYRGSHYELSASGVLLDAIALLKPIVALPSPTIREIFSREPSAGYLCDTPEQLVDVVSTLVSRLDEDAYRQQVSALRSLRSERSPTSLAKRYAELTDRLNSSRFSRS